MPSERSRGFTLVEVMVALAIVVIAFLAMYGSAQQVVATMTLLQEKTFASWIAVDQLTELRLAERLPDGDRISGETEMAGLEWRYVVEFQEVDSDYYRQAVVRVSPAEEPERIIGLALGVLPKQSPRANQPNSGSQLAVSSSETSNTGGTDSPQPETAPGEPFGNPDEAEQ